MYFGKRYGEGADRGLASGTKRQLLLLVAALAAIALIVFQFQSSGWRMEKTIVAPVPPGTRPGVGKPLPATPKDLVGDLPPPPEPQDPEPFSERPEMLERGSSVDRTGAFDEPLIAYLLQKVRTSGDALYKETPRLSLDREGDVVWQMLLDRPDEFRGELIEIKGEILSPEPGVWPLDLRGLDFPNPSGLDRAYQSYVLGVDSKYYMVLTVRKQRELAHRDGVRVRGLLCQLYTYPIVYQEERRMATIPLLVGDDYELLVRPVTPSAWAGEYLPLLIALGILGCVFVILFQGKSREQYQARRQEARAKRHDLDAARGAPGAGFRSHSGAPPKAEPPTPAEPPPHGEAERAP